LCEKIIPAFEHAHGPGYQALFIIDNSQRHSAYAEDALLASRMNFNSGGKQAHLRNGWFIHDGIKIIQPMIFPLDHPQFSDQPKGMKQVLIEHELFHNKLKKNARQTPAVQEEFLSASQISRARGLLFRKLMKMLVIFASFCQSFIVNLTLLNFSGVL